MMTTGIVKTDKGYFIDSMSFSMHTKAYARKISDKVIKLYKRPMNLTGYSIGNKLK